MPELAGGLPHHRPAPNFRHMSDPTTPAPPTSEPPPTADQVKLALRKVKDPELNLNIIDLGLVYDIAVENADVQIDMTLTSPGCPAGARRRRRDDQPRLAALLDAGADRAAGPRVHGALVPLDPRVFPVRRRRGLRLVVLEGLEKTRTEHAPLPLAELGHCLELRATLWILSRHRLEPIA